VTKCSHLGVVFDHHGRTLIPMERRLLAVLSAAAVAAVAVGLSAAATMGRSQPVEPSKKPQAAAKTAKKAVAKAPRSKTNEPVTVSSGQSQSTKEVESYWTKERMEDAQPMDKTRQGGSSSSSPAPSGSTAPGSVPTERSTPQESRTQKSQSPGDTGVSTSPAATPSPGDWTDEAMDGARPMEQTRPGGSGSQDSPELGGGTAPGSPPS